MNWKPSSNRTPAASIPVQSSWRGMSLQERVRGNLKTKVKKSDESRTVLFRASWDTSDPRVRAMRPQPLDSRPVALFDSGHVRSMRPPSPSDTAGVPFIHATVYARGAHERDCFPRKHWRSACSEPETMFEELLFDFSIFGGRKFNWWKLKCSVRS